MLKNAELRELTATNYFWPTFYFLWDWGTIFACALAAQAWPSWPLYFAAVAVIGGRQHALFVLIHEGVHKHLARRKDLNDFLANWLAGYPLLFDMHVYRVTHLKHHESLNTDLDPDWVRKRARKEWQFPVSRKALAAFIPYFLLVWGPAEWAIVIALYSGFFNKETYINPLARRRFTHKLVFYVGAALAISALGLWTEVALYWLVPLFLVFPGAQRMRSVSEHFGMTWADDLNSSRDVLSGRLENSVFAPHFVNFHLSHHLYPAVPCYQLPELHQKLMEVPAFRATAHLNSSYVGWGQSVLRDLVTVERAILPGSKEEPAQRGQSKAS